MGYKKWDDEYEPPMTAIDWKARAEAAEARANQLQIEIDNQIASFKQRISALEAATEWRPTSEPPVLNGDYLVWVKFDNRPGFQCVAHWTKRFKWEDNFITPAYWRLLPANPKTHKRQVNPYYVPPQK